VTTAQLVLRSRNGVGEVGYVMSSESTGEDAPKAFHLASRGLLLLAARASQERYRLSDVFLDDASRRDRTDLEGTKAELVTALRSGNTDVADAIVGDWRGQLYLTWVTLKDEVSGPSIRVTRDGVVALSGAETIISDSLNRLIHMVNDIFRNGV
jgi:hypothetical protein